MVLLFERESGKRNLFLGLRMLFKRHYTVKMLQIDHSFHLFLKEYWFFCSKFVIRFRSFHFVPYLN